MGSWAFTACFILAEMWRISILEYLFNKWGFEILGVFNPHVNNIPHNANFVSLVTTNMQNFNVYK